MDKIKPKKKMAMGKMMKGGVAKKKMMGGGMSKKPMAYKKGGMSKKIGKDMTDKKNFLKRRKAQAGKMMGGGMTKPKKAVLGALIAKKLKK